MKFSALNLLAAAAKSEAFEWLLCALVCVYLVAIIAVSLVVKRRISAKITFLSWLLYVAGVVIFSILMPWNASGIIFFVFAVIVAVGALVYLLFDLKKAGDHKESVVERKVDAQKAQRAKQQSEVIRQQEEKERAAKAAQDKRRKEIEEMKLRLEEIERALKADTQSEKDEEERQERLAAEKRAAAERQAQLNEKEAAKAESARRAKRAAELAALNAMILSRREGVGNEGFKLSREDVLDRMEEMSNDTFDYPVEPNIVARASDRDPDFLRAGSYTFALMFESSSGAIKFMARMDEAYAAELKKYHSGIDSCQFSGARDWYKVIVDTTFYSKGEVFMMLDNWYSYVMNEYIYDAKAKKYVSDDAKATEAEAITGFVAKEGMASDEAFAAAEKAHEELECSRVKNIRFKSNKRDIAEVIKARYPEVQATERADQTSTGLPLADTYYTPNGISDKGERKRVCFAYIYQRKDETVKIIAKLPKIYAEKMETIHSNMHRSKFPVGKNWYATVIDPSYESPDQVYALLARAKSFVESTETRD